MKPRRSAAPSPDLVMIAQVLRSGGEASLHLELRVMGPGGREVESLEGSKRIQVGDPLAYLASLFEPLRDMALLREGSEEKLAGVCASLAEQLLPDSIAARLAELVPPAGAPAPTLCLYSNETWIPWELLKLRYPGPFLAEAFAFTRWLRPSRPALTLPLKKLGLVVPKDSSLPQAAPEKVALLGLRSGEHDVEEVPARYLAVLRELPSGRFDGWHFSGHGHAQHDSPEMWGIRLEQGTELSSSDLADKAYGLGGRRPLVFLNACHSSRGAYSLTGISGLAAAFLKARAGGFLGAYWAIPDEQARLFAETFYGLFLAGMHLGEAVRQARLRLKGDFPGDPTRLAYAAFGDPLAASTWAAGQEAYRPPIVAAQMRGSLEIPHREYRPDVSPPGALLRADHGVVPFHGRERELEDLEHWALGERPLSVRLFTGAGGMGKTRLALETCLRLRDEGWRTGFLAPVLKDLPPEKWEVLQEEESPLLLVVDYAETRRDLLVALLKEVRDHDGFPVRVLLLARAALDWWEQLKREGQGVGELLSSAATDGISLQGLAMGRDARARSYGLAAEAFARVLARETPRDLPDDLDAEHFERVLFLHMTALAAIEGVPVKGDQGILDSVLDRETRFWHERAKDKGLPGTLAANIARGMAAITLGGGVLNESEGVEVLRKLTVFADERGHVLTGVVQLLHELYPGSRWIEPILPDLLGEHLVQRELEKGAEELMELTLGPRKT